MTEQNGVERSTATDILSAEQAIVATLGASDAKSTEAESSETLSASQVSNAVYAHSIHADCADADWQAIADELNATLGRGTCHVASSIIDTYEYNRWEYELSCGHTIIWEDSEPPNYCPNCGRRIVEEVDG